MKQNPLKLNVLLAAVVGVACLVLAVAQALAPLAIMPKFDLPMMLGLCLIALTIDAYWGPACPRPWLWTVALGAVTFALLPWCAGVTGATPFWMLGLAGAAVFGVSAALYAAAMERTATGPKAPLAPAGIALMLFLAGQCLSGLL